MGKITPLQVYMFFAQFLFSSAIGFFIGPLALKSGYISWFCILLGAGIGTGFAYLSCRFSMRRPDQFLGHYGKDILGRWLHSLVFGCVILLSITTAAFIFRQLIDFIVQIYLPNTPDWPIAVLFGFCVARGVRSGIVTLFQGAQGLFIISVISVLTFPLLASNQLNLDMAVAFVTDWQFHRIWNGTMLVTGLFAETAFIVYLFPYIVRQNKVMKAITWGVATSIVIIMLVLISSELLFGPELTANLTYPTLELIRYVHAGAFLENLDPLIIIFWLFSVFLKISLFLFIAVKGMTHILGLKDHKPFSYMMSAVMCVLSITMYRNMSGLQTLTNHSETTGLIFMGLVPVIYYAVDLIRNGKMKPRPNPNSQSTPD